MFFKDPFAIVKSSSDCKNKSNCKNKIIIVNVKTSRVILLICHTRKISSEINVNWERFLLFENDKILLQLTIISNFLRRKKYIYFKSILKQNEDSITVNYSCSTKQEYKHFRVTRKKVISRFNYTVQRN